MTCVSVVRLAERDLCYGFDNKPPYWRTRSKIRSYGSREEVDPTRGYAHDLELVKAEVAHVTAAFPIGVPVTFHVSRWEPTSRTNGWCSQDWNYYAGRSKKERRWEATIALHGKRIPLMPAMTRYLVAHEYGHAVDYWLCHIRDLQANGLDAEYRQLRKLPKARYYGPGEWHKHAGEVLANDFRILVCGREPEFWPHPCTHPLEDRAVRQWWQRALKEVA